ncbi:MAG: ACP S-malonyltransferase [Anaerolineae bacterium]|nr:ACP S-malonyltransferase [Anaerolineae bacterium]
MTVYIFPGQGSQEQGMGQALFDEVAEFTIWEPEIEALLGYSIRQLCLDNPHQQLKQTQYTQPALYVVNALHYLKALAEGQKPDYVAGHSLGEYNALLAAGAFDFMTGLKLVQKRGELMAQSREGSMAAVIGLAPEPMREALQANGLTGVEMANYNAPSQTVISGPAAEISRAEAVLNEAGARLVIPLQVSAAFHSQLMVPAAERFADFLTPFEFKALKIPVIANVTARPYPTANPTETIKKMVVEQITHPVQWTDSIRYLLGKGETEFEEIGPGAVLTGLVRRIRQEATPLIDIEETAEIDHPSADERSTEVASSVTPTSATMQPEPVVQENETHHQETVTLEPAVEEVAIGQPDNLQQIKGIGPKLEALLHEKGITTFSQLSALSHHQLDAWLQAAGWHMIDAANLVDQAGQLMGTSTLPATAEPIAAGSVVDEAAVEDKIAEAVAEVETATDEASANDEIDTIDRVPPTNGHQAAAPFHAQITAESLGSATFKADYGLKYAYIAGAMYKGIASKELVVAMGKAGMIGYLGTGGMSPAEIEADLRYIQSTLDEDQAYGMNLLANLIQPEIEAQTVDLFLRYSVRHIEAAAYMQMTPSLVRYRLTGIRRNPDGTITVPNYVLAKVSRPEVATLFMQPAPQRYVDKLVEQGQLTAEEAELSRFVPMSEDICVEADSGGHTDQGVAYALMPAMRSLRNEMMAQYNYAKPIRVGAAGGIGTPEAAAAAFMLGAEFILTGSINQCTVEAGMSAVVKDMLQGINVQDTTYAPAGDMFELGAKVQVLRRGVFFPARANKLYALYQQYNSLAEIDAKTQRQIQDKYFKRSFDDVWAETKAYYQRTLPAEVEMAERNPKHKMALIFRWYFVHSTRLAMTGSDEQRVDYQVHCGPALGAFNQWVKGTALEDWHNRHVAEIGEKLMQETAALLNRRFATLSGNGVNGSH